MSDLDDEDFAIRAPYIQRILELERKLAAYEAAPVVCEEYGKDGFFQLIAKPTSTEHLDKLLAEANGKIPEINNVREVKKTSDQSVEVTFSSCRAAGAFHKAMIAANES